MKEELQRLGIMVETIKIQTDSGKDLQIRRLLWKKGRVQGIKDG